MHVGRHGEGQVTLLAFRLAALLAVRAIAAIRIVDPCRQRFVTIIDDIRAGVVRGNRFRTWPWHCNVNLTVHKRRTRTVFRELPDVDREPVDQRGLLSDRRLDRVAESIGIRGNDRIVDETVAIAIEAQGFTFSSTVTCRFVVNQCISPHVCTHKDAGLVSMLEVRVFDVELAVVIDQLSADVLGVAAEAVATGQDRRLPGCGTTIDTVGKVRIYAVRTLTELLSFFVVYPLRTGRFDQHGRIETDLLVRRRAVVVMGEDDAEATIDALHVDHRVGEPALHRAARAFPLIGEVTIGGRAEERMIGGMQHIVFIECCIRKARGAHHGIRAIRVGGHRRVRRIRVPVVDGLDHLDHGLR